jgi:hypothetical protein
MRQVIVACIGVFTYDTQMLFETRLWCSVFFHSYNSTYATAYCTRNPTLISTICYK